MCQSADAHGTDARTLCHFRFFVYREYGEIRHLRRHMVEGSRFEQQAELCTEIAEFDRRGGHKRELARRLYFDTLSLSDPSSIVEPYEKEHSLTLDDLQEIFQAYPMGGALGGPAHSQIVRETIRLRHAIEASDENQANAAVENLRRMSHNTRRAIIDYRDLDAENPCCISASQTQENR